MSKHSFPCLKTLILLTLASPLALGNVVEVEVIAPVGSYVVSPAFGPIAADSRVENGQRHGADRLAHFASWRHGEQQVTEVLSQGIRYRLISHAGADLTPDPLSFPLVSAAVGASWQLSSVATINGISEPILITVHNGQFRLDNGAFTDQPMLAHAGQQLQLRHLSSASAAGTVVTSIQAGNRTATFRSVLADMDPEPFSFTAVTGAAVNYLYTSNAITVSGIDEPTPISVVGGSYSINGGSFVSTAGTVNNGDSVRVQLTSSASYSTMVTATLTIGSQSASYSVTTQAGSGGGYDDDGGSYGGGGTASPLLLAIAVLALWRRRT
ncbi:MAG: hypothetical protein ACOY3E_15495 [Pseudomonadota bacterium]